MEFLNLDYYDQTYGNVQTNIFAHRPYYVVTSAHATTT